MGRENFDRPLPATLTVFERTMKEFVTVLHIVLKVRSVGDVASLDWQIWSLMGTFHPGIQRYVFFFW